VCMAAAQADFLMYKTTFFTFFTVQFCIEFLCFILATVSPWPHSSAHKLNAVEHRAQYWMLVVFFVRRGLSYYLLRVCSTDTLHRFQLFYLANEACTHWPPAAQSAAIAQLLIWKWRIKVAPDHERCISRTHTPPPIQFLRFFGWVLSETSNPLMYI